MKIVKVGQRIPRDFFITEGVGQSDITIHAGSYHLALKAAGIEMCNIMQYSSILPAIANEIKERPRLVHGSVMECIQAVAHAKKGEVATAGIIYGWLYDETDVKYGGLVCEYNGPKSEKEVRHQLKASILELYHNGFSEDYILREEELIVKSVIPEKEYGTAIVSMCFVNYDVPIIGS